MPDGEQRPRTFDWQALVRWMDELHDSGFYGTVTLHFRGGLISVVKEQVLKPWDLRD